MKKPSRYIGITCRQTLSKNFNRRKIECQTLIDRVAMLAIASRRNTIVGKGDTAVFLIDATAGIESGSHRVVAKFVQQRQTK